MKIVREYNVVKTGQPFTVEVEIDLESIAQGLAARAIHSKGKKTSALQGAIKCKVITPKDPSAKPDLI